MAKGFRDFIAPYRVTNGKNFRLKDISPADTGGLDEGKEAAKEMLQEEVELLCALQEKLYAQDNWALLLVLQAMDAAGKDGTIKHVLSGVNPQGCEVTSFKTPSATELDHDYLWRSAKALPERGRIGIFNRSYYEEVLVVRVHPELLAKQKLPPSLVGKDIWEERYEDISAFERFLSRNGTVVRKFFLHLSHEEQRKRLLGRLETPEKTWKFSAADTVERGFWDQYMEAYEEAIRATASEAAPWYVVPADHKWFTRLVVAGVAVEALEEMKLAFPTVSKAQRGELATLRLALESEGKGKAKK
jgi:PPK2 family polyphosphate:nucleotide phosphotransferase